MKKVLTFTLLAAVFLCAAGTAFAHHVQWYGYYHHTPVVYSPFIYPRSAPMPAHVPVHVPVYTPVPVPVRVPVHVPVYTPVHMPPVHMPVYAPGLVYPHPHHYYVFPK